MILDETKKTVMANIPTVPSTVKAKTFQSLLNKGLEANAKFKKSMDDLAQIGLTTGTVTNIFQSQAELNKINTAWNSVASMSLILGQQKIGALELSVDMQAKKISELQRGLKVHQLVIEHLCCAMWRLASKYEKLRMNTARSAAILKILHSEIVLLKTKNLLRQSNFEWFLTSMNSAIGTIFKHGLLAILCDSLIRLSQLLSILEIVTGLMVSSKSSANRINLAARVSSILVLVLTLRKRYNYILDIIKQVLFR